LVCAKVVLALLWVSPDGFDAYQPPKALAGQALAVAMGACLLIALWTHGADLLPRTRFHLGVIFYLFTVMVAGGLAPDRYVALHGDVVAYEGVRFTVEMVVFYLAVVAGFRTTRDWEWLGGTSGAALSTVAVVAGAQALGLNYLNFPGGDVASRTISTLGNSEILAVVLGTGVGACVGLGVASKERRVIFIAAAGALMLVLAGGTTGTRGFLLSTLAVLITAFAVRARIYGLPRPRVLAAGASVVAGALALLMAFTPVGARTLSTISGAEPVRDRVYVYQIAFESFQDRPVFGWGPGNFEAASAVHPSLGLLQLFGPLLYYTSAHNIVVEALVATGVLGAASFVALLAVSAWRLWDGQRVQPLVAAPLLVGLAGYLAQAILSAGSVAIDWYPWLVLGGSVALLSRAERDAKPRQVGPLAVIGPALFLMAVAIVLSAPAYLANDAAGVAFRATRAGKTAIALDAARQAVALDDGRPRYWDRLGQVLAAQGRNREAGDAFAQAAARAPYHAEFWNNLAITRALQAQAGDESSGGSVAALAAASEGLAKAPQSPRLLYTSAYINEQMNAFDNGADLAAHAIVLYQGDSEYDSLLARLSGKAKPDVALEATGLALRAKDSTVLRLAAAQASLRSGDRATAIMHLKHILDSLDPSNAVARALLAQLTTQGG